VHTKRRYKDHKEHPTAKTKTSICIYRWKEMEWREKARFLDAKPTSQWL
jgi:hypothetical protein